jgi:streptogramin lyase
MSQTPVMAGDRVGRTLVRGTRKAGVIVLVSTCLSLLPLPPPVQGAAGGVGQITEFQLPGGGAQPFGITPGPDGNLWFGEEGLRQVGFINPSGTVGQFLGVLAGGPSRGITSGPDGNIWFTEPLARIIGRITPTGAVTEFVLPFPNAGPQWLVAGPGNNVWYTDSARDSIGRITPTGESARRGYGELLDRPHTSSWLGPTAICGSRSSWPTR